MKIYITQKIFDENICDQSFYGFFAIDTLPNGETEYYRRNTVLGWQKVREESIIEYYKRSEPIAIEDVLKNAEKVQ